MNVHVKSCAILFHMRRRHWELKALLNFIQMTRHLHIYLCHTSSPSDTCI